MARDATAFSVTSVGARAAGRDVKFVSPTPDGKYPWALIADTLPPMVTPGGTAWAEFELGEGDGDLRLLVARDSMNTGRGAKADDARSGVQVDFLGGVVLDGDILRWCTPGFEGGAMAAGEVVRIEYVAATRMVRVVWRGATADICALPAHHAINQMRFGLAGQPGNTLRLAGASAESGAGGACVRGSARRGACARHDPSMIDLLSVSWNPVGSSCMPRAPPHFASRLTSRGRVMRFRQLQFP